MTTEQHVFARMSFRNLDNLQCAHPNMRSAICELIDNSAAAGATSVRIRHNLLDEAVPPQNHFLSVEDDGRGMTFETMFQCLSSGYHVKHDGENADVSISHYGHGAKAAPFFFGKTAIFASCAPASSGQKEKEVTVMMLSREYHEEEPTPNDQLCIIGVSYRKNADGSLASQGVGDAAEQQHRRNVILLRKYSHGLFHDEEDIKRAGLFDGNGHGTRIFITDMHDHFRKRYAFHKDDICETVRSAGCGAFLYDHEISLRAHLAITYLDPKMEVFLLDDVNKVQPKAITMHDMREERWVPEIREWRPDFGDLRIQVGFNRPDRCGAPSSDDKDRETKLNRFNYTSGTFFYMRHGGAWRLVSFVPERVELHHSTGTSHRDRESSGSGLVANVFLNTSCPSLIRPFTPNNTKTALLPTPEHHAFAEALRSRIRGHRTVIANVRECRRRGVEVAADHDAERAAALVRLVRASRAIEREARNHSAAATVVTGKRQRKEVARFVEEHGENKVGKNKVGEKVGERMEKDEKRPEKRKRMPTISKAHVESLFASSSSSATANGVKCMMERIAKGQRIAPHERKWAQKFVQFAP
jgi:hypothetical protein